MSTIRTKTILILSFILLNILVYFVTEKNISNKIEYSKSHLMETLDINYKIFVKTQMEKADVIYDATINSKGIIDLLSQAWHTTDIKKRNLLRKKLIFRLQERYDKYKQQGLLQYHFVFPDNISFLRMHKLDKYYDDLSDVRFDYVEVNKTKKVIRGFSQGKVSHAFRNVYPLFDENNNHIGAVEISYPSELLQQDLNLISHMHSHFLVSKHIFESESWSRDDRIVHYKASYEHKDYLLTLSKIHEKDHLTPELQERLIEYKSKIDTGLKSGNVFSLVIPLSRANLEIVSFYPIFQNVTKELAAWIVAYEKSPYVASAITNSYYVRGIAFLILAFLFYLLYKTKLQQTIMTRLLSSIDQYVIFSTTDLSGKIQHVSSAFCKISGMKKEELLGKSHNIIRHPDMSQELFLNMWSTIQAKKVWKGELKNKRKDGSYYWVEAEIEPLYDEENKHIGYTAIRHDITDRKEYEKQQLQLFKQSKLAAMGEMIGNIAHQWRQPLSIITTSITGLAVKRDYGMEISDEDLQITSETITSQAEYLSNTIDDFRNFIRGSNEFTAISIKKVIENSINLTKASLSDHYITLVSSLEDDMQIKGNANELMQVMINIINNAKDAIKENIENEADKFILISTKKLKENSLELKICDSGGGIKKKNIDRVFEPYFTTKDQSVGTGLGLSMAYKIITERHKQTIFVQNEKFECNGKKYKGACFSIIFKENTKR